MRIKFKEWIGNQSIVNLGTFGRYHGKKNSKKIYVLPQENTAVIIRIV